MSHAITTVDLAEHAIKRLGALVQQQSAGHVFVVMDEAAAVASGADRILQATLASHEVTWFTGFELNPQIRDIERGIECFPNTPPDLVVALGGGTAIDLGKLIGTLAAQPSTARAIITGQASIVRPGPPLIAIPTTAGTGSEATQFAVAYVNHEKYSVAHPSLLPAHAIIDPTLTYSLPPRITAATGLDAFCQAIESIWAVGATDESIGFATEAVALAIEHLAGAVQCPCPESRRGMCGASHLAGKAINISKTTAPHAISYAFTSYHNIPHGMAVALTLSRMLTHNAGVTDHDCLDPRGATHVRQRIDSIVKLLGAKTVPDACLQIDALITSIDCACSPAGAGVTDGTALEKIVDSVNVERMSNNPRTCDRETLLRLLAEPVC